jgi:hypothetical protein
MKNKNLKQAVDIVTIGGAGVLVINSIMQMTKASSAKEFVMPTVSLLVGIAAVRYALSDLKTLDVKSA